MRKKIWLLISLFMVFTFVAPIVAFFGFDPFGIRLGGTMPLGYLSVLLLISGTGLAISFHQFRSASTEPQMVAGAAANRT